MNYFKLLGVAFGLVAFLKPFYMHHLPWDENSFIAKTYTEKRPAWIIPIALLGLAMVGYTWFMELTIEVRYSMVITIMFSLTAVKAIFFIFDYKRFYKWVAGMLSKKKGRDIIVVDILAGLFGLALVVLSIILF
jgi:hypothetical protein